MASIAEIDLGDIQSESQNKDASLFQMPLPLSDSNETLLLDLFGMMRTITVEGIITGTNSTHVTFIDNIESIMDGDQSVSVFISSKTGFANKNVYLNNFSWRVEEADVSKINYSLSMIEGE